MKAKTRGSSFMEAERAREDAKTYHMALVETMEKIRWAMDEYPHLKEGLQLALGIADSEEDIALYTCCRRGMMGATQAPKTERLK